MLRREVKKNPGIAQTIRGVTNCKGQMMLKHIKTEYKDQEPTAIECATDYEREDKIECEKLQGFPPGYTAIPWRKKPADQCPDGPRYRALGNSWAVPNVRWIGQRIDAAVRRLR